MSSIFAPAHMQRIAFDGVWRPEPWLAEDRWRAVRYRYLSSGPRRTGERKMDEAIYRTEEAAQVRCNDLNATRKAVRAPAAAPKRPETLL